MGRSIPALTGGLPWATLIVAYPAALVSVLLAIEWGFPPDLIVVSGAGNAALLIAGTVAVVRRPSNLVGPLMLAAGTTGFLVILVLSPDPLVYWLGNVMGGLTNTFLVCVVLASPSGRLESTADRLALAGLTIGFMAFTTLQVDAVQALGPVLGLVGALVLLVAVVRHWQAASPPARFAVTPVAIAGTATAAIFAGNSLTQILGIPTGPGSLAFAADGIGRTLIPFGFLAGTLRLRTARAAVADLVLGLSELPAERIRDALAASLGDPTIDVVYWSAAFKTFLDRNGVPVELPADGTDRAFTLISHDGRPMAAILHDPALADDPGLVAAVGAAVRMAVDNDRLAEEIRSQLEEVRASRARIVEAADAERRRVERNLHDGAQQRLVALSLTLRRAQQELPPDAGPVVRATLDDATEQLKIALEELRELAKGIHPAILTEAGLGPALRSLAHDSTVPVTTAIELPERLPETVEAAAYFVAAEALANVGKYAEASRVELTAEVDEEQLRIEIADDGRGGADPAIGSGLRGLHDRVAALDGRLDVRSVPGEGTRVVARLPVVERAGAGA